DRLEVFAQRFAELQQRFYSDVSGQQNDIRIASNLAQLGAAFEQFVEYLSDVWPEGTEVARSFVEGDLLAIRASMLGEAKEQQASEIFLRTLAELIQYGRVRIDGIGQRTAESKPLIGKLVQPQGVCGKPIGVARLEISMPLARGEVNKLLREQGSPELKAT